MDEQRKENERLNMEVSKKETEIKELQTQLGRVRMEAQVLKRKKLMNEVSKHIAHLKEQRKEGPRKAVLHVKKII